MARPDTTQFRTLLEPARQVVILLPQNPHYDAVAAGLALKIALESVDKHLVVACADPMTVEFNRLIGIDTVTTSFGSGNFIIAFADQTDVVDKVSYNLDRGELQLVITPKKDAPALDHRKLRFIPGSVSADLAILVSVDNLFDLGPMYHDTKALLSNTPMISITRNIPAENYTPHALYDPDASSVSELVAHLIDASGLNLHVDAATNLLSGLEKATDLFRSPQVSHTTFELAAHLIRKGARRHHDAISTNAAELEQSLSSRFPDWFYSLPALFPTRYPASSSCYPSCFSTRPSHRLGHRFPSLPRRRHRSIYPRHSAL